MNDRIRKKQLRRAKEMLPPAPIVLNIDAKALARLFIAAISSPKKELDELMHETT